MLTQKKLILQLGLSCKTNYEFLLEIVKYNLNNTIQLYMVINIIIDNNNIINITVFQLFRSFISIIICETIFQNYVEESY